MKRPRTRPAMTAAARSAPVSIPQLRRRIAGGVVTGKDAAYERAVSGFGDEMRPAMIVTPFSAADVATVVSFAATHRLTVTTRPEAGAILVAPTFLTGLEIDRDTWTARVEPGVSGSRLVMEAEGVGLAPVLDTEPSHGIVTGVVDGGPGWLARRYGLGIDHVRSVELVTGDGVIRSASVDDEPDLFWAVGAAGSDAVGVITSIEIELAPVGAVHAGELEYPNSELEAVVDRYIRWADETPNQLTAALVLGSAGLGRERAGSTDGPSILLRGCHLGSDVDADAALDYWRRWRAPDVDRWTTTTFGAFAMGNGRGIVPWWLQATHWMTDLNPDLLIRLAELVSAPAGEEGLESVQIIDLGPSPDPRPTASGRARGRWCLTVSSHPLDPDGIADVTQRLDQAVDIDTLPVLRPDISTRRRLRRVREYYEGRAN